MDKKRILEKLGGILTDLHSQQQFLLENTDMLNQVEAALFSANASYLADYAAILEKITAPPAQGTQGTVAVPPVLRKEQEEQDDDIGFRLGYEEKEQQETASGENFSLREDPASEEDTVPAADPVLEEDPASGEDTASGPLRPQEPEAARGPSAPQESHDGQEPAAGSGIAAAESQPAAADEPSPGGGSFPRSEPFPQNKETSPRAGSTSRQDEATRQGASDQQEASSPQEPSFPADAPDRQEISGTLQEKDPGIQGEADSGLQEEAQPGREGSGRRMSLNERFQERKTSLYDKIASGQGGKDSQADKPITNLGRSIGINERYYFIKTLFNDDKVAFDQAITRVDMCHSLGEALEYVNKSLSGRYGWSRKEEDSRKFYDLLKRRFI